MAATCSGRRWPRTSANTVRAVGARATSADSPSRPGALRLGPKPPEVTLPIGSADAASANSSAPSRTGARPSGRSPTRRRGAPLSNCARMTVGAGKAAGAGAAGAAALLHRPFQPALDRRRGGVDVVAVKAEAGLEPQAVARAEPDRQHIGIVEQHRDQLLGLCGRHRNLETVLAGIAGARDKAVERRRPCAARCP